MWDEVDELLEERGVRYGEFDDLAEISQSIKTAFAIGGRTKLGADQAEALEMIAHKIARTLNGDPNYVDSWADIAGYAQLIVRRLKRDAGEAERAEPDFRTKPLNFKKIKKAFKVLRQAGILNQTA